MATYTDDCTALTAWSEVGITTGTQYSIVSGGIEKASNNSEILQLDAVNSDADRQDAEVLVKMRVSAVGTSRAAFVRGIGSTGATLDGYAVAIRTTALRIYRVDDGVFTQIDSDAVTHAANTDYWVRLRVNNTGNIVRATSWADGGSEGGWINDITDSTYQSDGYVGLVGSADSATYRWTWIGVGTNGDTAPSSAASGFVRPTTVVAPRAAVMRASRW